MDGKTLRMVTSFSVDDVTPLSDHSSIRVTLDTHVEHANNRVQPAGLLQMARKNNIENQSIVLNHNNSLEQFLIISPQVTQM